MSASYRLDWTNRQASVDVPDPILDGGGLVIVGSRNTPGAETLAVERSPAAGSLIDVLDRVLDKGIVVDAYARISCVAIDLVGTRERIMVESADTHLEHEGTLGVKATSPRSRTAVRPGEIDRILAENLELRRRLARAEGRQPPEAR